MEYEPEAQDIEWGGWRAERAQLKRPHRSSLPNYGFAPPPIRMEYRYPRAVFFVLATKFFEAFAANGIRSKLYVDLDHRSEYNYLFLSARKISKTRLISGTEIQTQGGLIDNQKTCVTLY